MQMETALFPSTNQFPKIWLVRLDLGFHFGCSTFFVVAGFAGSGTVVPGGFSA
jgi:hypothetical protein